MKQTAKDRALSGNGPVDYTSEGLSMRLACYSLSRDAVEAAEGPSHVIRCSKPDAV